MRAKGSGSVKRVGKKRYMIRYDAPQETDGSRVQKAEVVNGTYKQAESLLREQQQAVYQGTYVVKTKKTVTQFMEHWLVTYAASNTRPRTQMGYRAHIRRHVGRHIGGIQLQLLRAEHIQRMYQAMLDDGLSGTTVRNVHRILSQALGHAVKWSELVRNPADAVTAPRPSPSRIKMWNPSTLNRFLDQCEISRFSDLYRFTMRTGLRRGELLGLRWKDVDLKDKRLMVVNTLQRIDGHGLLESPPKTSRSRRSLALGQEAMAILRSVRSKQLEQRLRAGPAWRDTGYVFTLSDGRPIEPGSVTRDFRATVVKLGLSELNLHGLRHAFAPLMLLAGVSAKVVSEMMGHSSVMVTLDTYSHVVQGLQEHAVSALDQYLVEVKAAAN